MHDVEERENRIGRDKRLRQNWTPNEIALEDDMWSDTTGRSMTRYSGTKNNTWSDTSGRSMTRYYKKV